MSDINYLLATTFDSAAPLVAYKRDNNLVGLMKEATVRFPKILN